MIVENKDLEHVQMTEVSKAYHHDLVKKTARENNARQYKEML